MVSRAVGWTSSVACLLYKRSARQSLLQVIRIDHHLQKCTRLCLSTCQLPWPQGARAGEHGGSHPVELQASRPPAAAPRQCGQPAEGQVRRRQQQACYNRLAVPVQPLPSCSLNMQKQPRTWLRQPPLAGLNPPPSPRSPEKQWQPCCNQPRWRSKAVSSPNLSMELQTSLNGILCCSTPLR